MRNGFTDAVRREHVVPRKTITDALLALPNPTEEAVHASIRARLPHAETGVRELVAAVRSGRLGDYTAPCFHNEGAFVVSNRSPGRVPPVRHAETPLVPSFAPPGASAFAAALLVLQPPVRGRSRVAEAGAPELRALTPS